MAWCFAQACCKFLDDVPSEEELQELEDLTDEFLVCLPPVSASKHQKTAVDMSNMTALLTLHPGHALACGFSDGVCVCMCVLKGVCVRV